MGKLKLRQLYYVNGQKLKLIEIHLKKLPRIWKAAIEYIFRSKKGETTIITDRDKIKEIKNER